MAKKTAQNRGIHIIKKANQLIEARYRFDIWETRVFLSVLAQIRMDDPDLKTYRIWYKDVIKIFGIKSHQAYGLLREASRSLMAKTFNVNYTEDGFQREKAYHIIRTADYLAEGQTERSGVEQQEYIEISVEPEMKPLLLQLQKNFTAYDLRNVVQLGAQPVRLYELLKQYESIGERKIMLDELRRMLEFGTEYPLFADFFRYFIAPAVEEINKHTDLDVHEVEKLKQGKRVAGLFFRFRKKSAEAMLELRGGGPAQSVSRPKNAEPMPSSESAAAFFERLNEWWGVQKDEFLKRAAGKSPGDIEAAIFFTKSKVKLGKAANPAGVFLDALSKKLRSTEQIEAEKKAERFKKETDKKAQIAELLAALETIRDGHATAINDAIRAITTADPTATERAIDRVKTAYEAMGDRSIDDKTVQDFRESPLLRALVKGEIMRSAPDDFVPINQDFGTRGEALKRKILELEPSHRF